MPVNLGPQPNHPFNLTLRCVTAPPNTPYSIDWGGARGGLTLGAKSGATMGGLPLPESPRIHLDSVFLPGFGLPGKHHNF